MLHGAAYTRYVWPGYAPAFKDFRVTYLGNLNSDSLHLKFQKPGCIVIHCQSGEN